MSEVFTPDVVAAVAKHMNDDHGADNVVICRAFGPDPDVTDATMTGMDAGGIDFAASGPGGEVDVRIPWGGPIESRGDVRVEVVRLFHAACERLGIEVEAGEH